MEEKKSPDDIDRLLNIAVESEIEKDEKIIWSAKPETQGMPLQLLKIPLIWLVGLFIYSIGTLTDTSFYEANEYFNLVIVVFVLIALMGIAEIVAIPIQAKKTIYVITNLRTLCIKLRGKFGFSGQQEYSGLYKKMLRPEKSTLYFYWAYTVPFQLIFVYLISDVVIKIFADFNILCFAGFLLLMSGWFYQWYQDYRIPLPRFRDCPRAIYYINEWLTSVESVPHSMVNKIAVHKGRSGLGDIFVLASAKGCMRMKSIPAAADVFDIIKSKTEPSESKDD